VRWTALALFTLASAITACGAPTVGGSGDATTTTQTDVSTTQTEVTTTASAGGTLDIIVPPNANGKLPPDLMVACPNGPAFPASALETIVPLEEADPGIGDAIGSFLENEEGQFWPQEGWLVLHQDETTAIVVAEMGEGPAFMQLTKSGTEWEWSGSQSGGPCPLQYIIPDGLNTVDWRLDDTAPAPAPDDVTVAVLLNERECVSGQEIGDRLLDPQVVMTETQVLIAFASEPPPGDAFDCQGNPDMAYVVELGQPLGERELVEGLSTGVDLEDYLP